MKAFVKKASSVVKTIRAYLWFWISWTYTEIKNLIIHPDKRVTVVLLDLPVEVIAQIDTEARQRGVSRDRVVNDALRDFIKEYKEKAPTKQKPR